MSVNVLGLSEVKLYILRKDKFNDQRRMGNLLLIAEEGKKHYAAVKNLSQLLASSNSDGKRRENFSLNCLQGFHSEGFMNKHFMHCVHHEAVMIDMLQENSFVRFYSEQYQFKVPFVVYANFEVILHVYHLCIWKGR